MDLDSLNVAAVDVTDRIAFRVAEYDTPFWARSNSRPARWHSIGVGPTQYFTYDPRGAWAEIARAQNIRAPADLGELRMRIWAAKITCGNVADFSTFDRCEAAGVDPELLIADDHAWCRELGDALRLGGFRGVLAPSAAHPSSINLTLFGPRTLLGWNNRPILASSVPATVVAVGGPPLDLPSTVRYIGMEHEGFVQHVQHKTALDAPALSDEIEEPDA